MAYGYGVAITPLQTLAFYNAIANDGEMVKPRFISQISNLGNLPTKVFSKQTLNPSVCSKETLNKVQQMLYNVVDKKWGTAFNIKDELLSMAGKTGTCQVDYTSEEVQYISSFVGYYPVENPKYSCIVVIHRPNKSIGYYGSTVAAPVFKTIAKKIFNDIPKKIEISYSAFTDLDNNTVPNVKGLYQKEAIKKLKNKGITVKVKGKGIVKSQSIKPGSKIKNQQKIVIESS